MHLKIYALISFSAFGTSVDFPVTLPAFQNFDSAELIPLTEPILPSLKWG